MNPQGIGNIYEHRQRNIPIIVSTFDFSDGTSADMCFIRQFLLG